MRQRAGVLKVAKVKRLVILVAVLVVVLAGGTAGALALRHHPTSATKTAVTTKPTISPASDLQTVSTGCTSLTPLSGAIANSINISLGLAPGPQNVAGLSSFVQNSDAWLKVAAMGSVTSPRYSQLVADVKQLTTAMPGALQAGNALPLRPMAIAVTNECAALGEIAPQSPPTVNTAPPGASYQVAHTVSVGCHATSDVMDVTSQAGAEQSMTPIYAQDTTPNSSWSAVTAMASLGPPYQQLAKATQLFVQFSQPSPTATVSNVDEALSNILVACLNLGQSTVPTSQATVPTAPAIPVTTLPVPSGSNTVTVPSMAGLSQAGAATVLGKRGLTFSGTTSQPSSSWPEAGIVIGSVPASGTSVLSGSGVTLIVSSGPPPTTTTTTTTTTPVPTTTTVP